VLGDKAYSSAVIRAPAPPHDQGDDSRARGSGEEPAAARQQRRPASRLRRRRLSAAQRGRAAFCQLRQHRAVATRYDKRDFIWRGTIDVASIRIWLRHPVS
jgi:hypothetical protein